MEKNEKIVGYLNKHGEYNGITYDNYILVTITSVDGFNRSCDCKTYKFKRSECYNVLGFSSPDSIVGYCIKKSSFDRYGRLTEIELETK